MEDVRKLKRYTVIARPDELSEHLKKQIEEELDAHGYISDNFCPEVVFVVGGDGTFIFAVHHVMRTLGIALKDVCFYGIHTGTLGFYTDYRDCDYREFMDTFLAGGLREKSYPLLQARFLDQKHHGINEIRIENAARTQVMDIYINGEYFETFRGTGICVCTQWGSTAYNRSLGGAVMQEGLRFIEMTEISGIHHNKFRSLDAPLILRDDTKLEFKSESFRGALLGCDSYVYPLDDCQSVSVYITNSASVRVLSGRDVSYFDRLKSLF